MILSSLMLSAAIAWAGSGPAGLEGLKEGQVISGFTAQALYLNADDRPMGARFVYRDGMPVDVLFFASVPQVSIYAKTLPISDRGESHTQEHLLLGKGAAGKYLNSLMDMRLGEYTAGTYQDLTDYQFNTAAGPKGFYDLLEAFLNALLHPNYSDEEIRREVAHLEALPDENGKLHLEEKGTVYNEMVTTTEKADERNWYQLLPLLYGKGHPLSREQGGLPADIRELAPEGIHAYHDANYHLGPNMEMTVALPLDWSIDDFLKRLDELFAQAEPEKAARTYPRLPPPSPLGKPEIRIGSFPSDDPSVPQDVLIAWKPLSSLSEEDHLRIGLLLNLLGGSETSYLYQDLVDRKTRKSDFGATGVSSDIDAPPLAFPLIAVTAVPSQNITPEVLGRLRSTVEYRVLRLARLAPGSPELQEAADKARSLISAGRRGMLKFMDDPPLFGRRSTGIDWPHRLDLLNSAPGFRKSVSQKETFDALLSEIDAGKNPWAEIARRAGMLDDPFVSAVRPDAALLQADKKDKKDRLAAKEAEIQKQYGLADPQAALARFQEGYDAKTKELEARDRGIPKPKFVQDPPMTLDDVPYKTAAVDGRPLVASNFGSTPFTDISLRFDLTHIPSRDLDLLPLLPSALAELGAETRDGRMLDYVQAQELRRSEIYDLEPGIDYNPETGREELTLTASASSPREVDKAAEWLEDYLLRNPLTVSTSPAGAFVPRLLDLARQGIEARRNTFQSPEEYWARDAANAYVYQDQPVYEALNSPFTSLHHLTRLRWRLDDSPPQERAKLLEILSALDAMIRPGEAGATVPALSKDELAKRLQMVEGDMGDFLRFELAHLPPDHWREDFSRLIRETRADLNTPTSATISRLAALLRAVLVRDGARVELMGNSRNTDHAAALAKALLDKLPEGAPGPAIARRSAMLSRLKERYPDIARPVHVGLLDQDTKSGVHVLSADGPSYLSPSKAAAIDMLTGELFSGGGPHSFFMKTWAAGLAYSNGIHPRPRSGRISYYAERCPDLAQTMKFVVDLASRTPIDDPFLVQYSLANAFNDYRGAGTFSERASALADDLTDGITPETVRAFKTSLIQEANRPDALEAIRRRMPAVLGRVLPGYGVKVKDSPDAVGFEIGPEDVLAKYELYLKSQGEADRLIRLYPRDFWPDE